MTATVFPRCPYNLMGRDSEASLGGRPNLWTPTAIQTAAETRDPIRPSGRRSFGVSREVSSAMAIILRDNPALRGDDALLYEPRESPCAAGSTASGRIVEEGGRTKGRLMGQPDLPK
jgi:hypothetical protein